MKSSQSISLARSRGTWTAVGLRPVPSRATVVRSILHIPSASYSPTSTTTTTTTTNKTTTTNTSNTVASISTAHSQGLSSEKRHSVSGVSTGLKNYSNKASNLINSILHGSDSLKSSTQELEKTIAERGLDGLEKGDSDTHSKLLSKGPEITEIIFHSVKPDKASEYVNFCSNYYSNLSHSPASKNVRLVGSWSTAIGEQDTYVHILSYPSYKDYSAFKLSSATHSQFENSLAPSLYSRRNQICLEFAFWQKSVQSAASLYEGNQTDATPKSKKIYELRTYELKPGRMLEWKHHWQKGLACRVKFCQPVGAWFSQLGKLHHVHHIWAYSDLEARKLQREAAWQIDGWANTVTHTVRLVNHMNASILTPLAYSPLK